MVTQEITNFIMNELHVVSEEGIKQNVTLTDGKSGAEVYRMHVISRRPRDSGVYILKLIDTENVWYDPDKNEASKGTAVWKQNTPFKGKLVELCTEKVIGKYHVILYRQANDSVLNTITLAKLKVSEKCDILKCLSYDLLKKWNCDISKTGDAKEIFDNLLSYRLDPCGSFERKMSSVLVEIDASAFLLKNSVYPNPYYYVRNKEKWIDKIIDLPFLKGNIHGDLHQRNVMCGKGNSREGQYYLIDYDAYQDEGYLLFDHSYLEMSIYFDMMEKYDAEKWNEAVSLLFAKGIYEKAEGEIDEPLVYLRNAIYEGIIKWVTEEQPHMKDSIEIQFLITRIAAGINYFSKGAIQEQESLIRLLQYMGESFKALFKKIDFEWSAENISKLDYLFSKDDYVEVLWENCVRYAFNYVPVLITDDNYKDNEYKQLKKILGMKWAFVIDIGEKVPPADFTSVVASEARNSRNVSIYNLVSTNTPIEYCANKCVWLVVKKDVQIPTYGIMWARYYNVIEDVFEQILSQEGLKPILFVFDIKKGQAFVQKFLQCILKNYHRLEKSRIIALGRNIITHDDIQTLTTLGFHYFSESNSNLVDLAETVYLHLPHMTEKKDNVEIVLPTIDTIEPVSLTEKEINYYESSVELVYEGIEVKTENSSFGEAFYRGEEISWLDLANECAFELIDNYARKRDALLKAIEEESPRVKSLKLIHGAGTGGTTLSKKLLWDLKGNIPCMRLKKYTQDTANIILEINHKTGKRVFMTVEMGSTILDGEDLNNFLSKVNEGNGKLMVLEIERSNNKQTQKPFIAIHDTLQDPIANEFCRQFKRMTDDVERIKMLEKITAGRSQEWMEQRCPFFYGFYTFQEEYNLSIICRTVQGCDSILKGLLSDLALITIYSQNICIRNSELPIRLRKEKEDEENESVSSYLLYEELDPAVKKLIGLHEEGWRICHPLIAKKVLCELYGVEQYQESVYNASIAFIDRIHNLYGKDDKMADRILKELFVDRAYIDSERTRFSYLIEDIQEYTKRKTLFEKLIELYPSNPHYYNHLARLLVESSTKAYDEATDLLKKAIKISERENITSTVHYSTLGCIYCKSIYAYINEEKSLQRSERFAASLSDLIKQIGEKYILAESAFYKARQTSVKHNSYAYFPQIQMESVLIQKIVGYDKGQRSMGQLLREETDFEKWYREHYGNAMQLYMDMKRHYETYDKSYKEFMDKAKGLIDSIGLDTENIEQKLTVWNNQEGSLAVYCRRTYISSIYAQHGYSWNKMDDKLLRIIVEGMHKNISQSSHNNIKQGDIYYWYEAYRRLKEFDAREAISFIEDYMDNDYEKEYLLFILHFLQMEKDLSTSAEVVKHIKRCKDMVPAGINTLSFRDAYSTSMKGSPIISNNDVRHIKGGGIVGLREFRGAITEIRGNTAGVIQIDGMNMTAIFIPSIVDESGTKREFTSKNVTDRVKFNLMFSYSGLRAWNVNFE